MNRSDAGGGAARAATGLFEGVSRRGLDAELLVQRRTRFRPGLCGPSATAGKALGPARRILESLVSGQAFTKSRALFSPALLPDRLAGRIARFDADVIHLHWVARMMRLETLARIRRPIVWTLHDSWPFTGGCFLPGECERFRQACGKCPALSSTAEEDLSRRTWERKRDAWRDTDLTLIAPSRWMAKRARESSLFRARRVEVIANGIDTDRFAPVAKDAAREALGLPRDKKLLLFGAKSALGDRNKGFHLLRQSLRDLPPAETELVIFGADSADQPEAIELKSHFLGWQSDDAVLARLYSAADAFILPSLQENLPYALMEAMACGTPCVAFRQGGVADLIDHRENGYLARAFDPTDLGRGIRHILSDPARGKEMGSRARRKIVTDFAFETVVDRHLELYRDLLRQS